jgi:hypothetical protein
MTRELLLWACSAAGAGLFFAAGRLAVGRRAAVTLGPAPPAAEPEQAPRRAPDLERLRTELTAAHTRLAELLPENARLEALLAEARLRADQARARIGRGQSEREELAQQLQRLPALEAELDERRTELERWPQRLADLEGRLAAAGVLEQTVRQELAVAEQRLEIGEQRLRQLEEENASLRAVPRDQVCTESAELRARGSSRLRLRQPAATAGNRLQALIEQVRGLGDFRSAVVADDLGLVVASQGELADEVAAVGALFGQAALQAQRELPLRTVQRVIVEGERGLVLAVRPIRLQGDVDLSLVTLGVGAPPDVRQLSQLAGTLNGDEPRGSG